MSSTLSIVITDAGIAEVVNAQHNGTAPVVLSQVGFGRGIYTPTASQTALHDEIKRVDTIAGGVVDNNIMHIQALDSGEEAYAVYEIGVYTASGTLFAVYSQALPILHKVANSSIMCVIDFVLSGVEPTAVTVGDTDYTLAPATASNQGVVELATVQETIAGTDATRAVTPAGGAAAYVSISKSQIISGDKAFDSVVDIQAGLTNSNNGKIKIDQALIPSNPSSTTNALGTIDAPWHSAYIGGLRLYSNSVWSQSAATNSMNARMIMGYGYTSAGVLGTEIWAMTDYAEIFVESYKTTSKGSLQFRTNSTTRFEIAYDSSANEYCATFSVPIIANNGVTGLAPSQSDTSTVDIPIGGIVAVWFPGNVFGVGKVGNTFTPTANTYYVAYNNNGTMQQGSQYIPAGTYVNLMERQSNSTATWALMQRTA